MLHQQPKPANASLPAQVLHHVTRRWPRQKSHLMIGVALFFLVIIWTAKFLHGDLTFDDYVPTSHDRQPSQSGWRTPIPASASENGTVSPMPHNIPPKIWQISLPKEEWKDGVYVDPKGLQDTPSWLAMNTDYSYTLVGERGAEEFVRNNFAHRPEVIDAFERMPNVGMKSDLLRYLILEVEGGVYTDTDTIALKPIDKWVPAEFRDRANLVVGIEFDRLDGGAWADINHWVQFCQWTIAAAPGHPVFRRMVNRILKSLDDLSHIHNVTIDRVKPSSFEVMNSTGPAAWTDMVFEQLQEYEPRLNDTEDLSGMKGPVLYGDVLVLTIDGFGMGQGHSKSTNDGSIPDDALVKHNFRGSWRGEKRKK
ncbi:glycosyltransferase [Echria macrotheca]|uniref:Glycosyltransferase n=1 Tax=Echria macrotheca TaxID=438768 RepID=A0AAJ0F1S0_9PEZI|nr:glycosyltransferase [Echria macrotheca]